MDADVLAQVLRRVALETEKEADRALFLDLTFPATDSDVKRIVASAFRGLADGLES